MKKPARKLLQKSTPKLSKPPAAKSKKDDAVWQARVDLAAAYRLANRFGLSEGIDNHFTLAVPGRGAT